MWVNQLHSSNSNNNLKWKLTVELITGSFFENERERLLRANVKWMITFEIRIMHPKIQNENTFHMCKAIWWKLYVEQIVCLFGSFCFENINDDTDLNLPQPFYVINSFVIHMVYGLASCVSFKFSEIWYNECCEYRAISCYCNIHHWNFALKI